MEIGGIDHITDLTHEEIVRIVASEWAPFMLIQDVNEPNCKYYDEYYHVPLPEEFFIYRDDDAYNRSLEDGEDNLEGMIYVIDKTVVYDHNTPADVLKIISKIPKG